jgi:hypothetical protein
MTPEVSQIGKYFPNLVVLPKIPMLYSGDRLAGAIWVFVGFEARLACRPQDQAIPKLHDPQPQKQPSLSKSGSVGGPQFPKWKSRLSTRGAFLVAFCILNRKDSIGGFHEHALCSVTRSSSFDDCFCSRWWLLRRPGQLLLLCPLCFQL